MSSLTLGLLAWLLVGLMVAVVAGFFMRDRFVEPETRLHGFRPNDPPPTGHESGDRRRPRAPAAGQEADPH